MDSSNAELCAGFTTALCPKIQHMSTVTDNCQNSINLSANHELSCELLMHSVQRDMGMQEQQACMDEQRPMQRV